jgi:hypothetical protein
VASIPLAANNLKIPEPGPNALDLMRQVAQLRAAGQENQKNDLEIQQKQRAMQDDTTIREAYGRNKGDVDKTLQDIAGKVSPTAFQAAQQHALDLKQKAAALVQQQGSIALQQSDAMQGAHDVVDKAPADQKPIVYQQQLQGLQKMGVDVSQMPPQYPGDDQFKNIGIGLKTHSKLVEEAAKQAEGAKNQAQAGEATARTGEVQANTGKIKAEMAFYQKQGLAPGVPLDAQEAADWMNKNKGKSVSDFMKYKATLVPQMNFNLNNQVPKGEGGQPSAMAQAVAAGQMKWGDVISPRTPMAVKEAFAKEVKSINPQFNSGDFAIEQGVKKSFTSGKVSDELNAYNTAIAHADLLKSAADAMNNGNVRALNSIGNQLGVQFGSDKATNFQIIRNAYTAEVTKALTSGHITDTELNKQGGTMPDNASPQQMAGAVTAYKALMASKKQQRQDQYEKGTQAQPNFGNQPAKGMIQARDPQGKLHQAVAGTALPAGWKLEQ